jgi:cyclophilin family peptidyl-prolyl cis-trans isomerase
MVDDDLRALLTDEDPTVRSRAVLAVGQIGNPSTLPDLEAAASDAAADPRASAAFALGLFADASRASVLVVLAGDPAPNVRAAAAEALGRLHVAAGVPAVRALLDDDDTTVRTAAALAAWKFEDAEPFLDPLISNLAAPGAGVRVASAYALARLASVATAPPSSGASAGKLSDAGVARARAALAQRVTDSVPEVRMQVARGLVLPTAGTELAAVGALTKDPDPGVRVNAVRSLGYPGVPIKPYLEHAAADRDQSVARAALEAVGKVGGAGAEEALSKALPRLESDWLREAALSALARVAPSRAPKIVNALLSNTDPQMRVAAAAILAGHKEPGAIAAAVSMLHDAAPSVQAAAVPLVADQDGPVAALLEGFFESPDPVVRAAVGEAVGGRLATPHPAVESKVELFQQLDDLWAHAAGDTSPDVKLAVVDAVAKAGRDDQTRAALTRALADPDVVVRGRAAARFKDVYDEDKSRDVGPASDRALSEYERIVRFSLAPHAAIVTMRRPGSSFGRFVLALDASAAPMAAWNFFELASRNFFDGRVLHRVVPNFVVQDGDPRGDGFGGPGYSIRDEYNPLRFTAGVLGMASDGKDTAGSQWFITLSAQPHLDGRYTSFGHVTQGLREIVSQMRPGDTVISIRAYTGDGFEPLPSN